MEKVTPPSADFCEQQRKECNRVETVNEETQTIRRLLGRMSIYGDHTIDTANLQHTALYNEPPWELTERLSRESRLKGLWISHDCDKCQKRVRNDLQSLGLCNN